MNASPEPSSRRHWLYRPENLRKLWWWGGVVLALTVVAQLVWPIHGHFGVDEWLGFFAVYGFGTCVAMIVGANLLGRLVKRKDTYYDE